MARVTGLSNNVGMEFWSNVLQQQKANVSVQPQRVAGGDPGQSAVEGWLEKAEKPKQSTDRNTVTTKDGSSTTETTTYSTKKFGPWGDESKMIVITSSTTDAKGNTDKKITKVQIDGETVVGGSDKPE